MASSSLVSVSLSFMLRIPGLELDLVSRFSPPFVSVFFLGSSGTTGAVDPSETTPVSSLDDANTAALATEFSS